MKKYIFTLLFFTASIVFSQEKVIYLICDEGINCNNKILKLNSEENIYYSFFKTIPTETYNYSYSFNENNELVKGMVAEENWNIPNQVSLYSNSERDQVLKISIDNVIRSSDLSNIKWKSFKDICNKADKIFILNEVKGNELYYYKSELKFKPYVD